MYSYSALFGLLKKNLPDSDILAINPDQEAIRNNFNAFIIIKHRSTLYIFLGKMWIRKKVKGLKLFGSSPPSKNSGYVYLW